MNALPAGPDQRRPGLVGAGKQSVEHEVDVGPRECLEVDLLLMGEDQQPKAHEDRGRDNDLGILRDGRRPKFAVVDARLDQFLDALNGGRDEIGIVAIHQIGEVFAVGDHEPQHFPPVPIRGETTVIKLNEPGQAFSLGARRRGQNFVGLGLELPGEMPDHFFEDAFLAFEIEIDRPLGYARASSDVFQARRRKAVLGEFLERGFQNFARTFELAPFTRFHSLILQAALPIPRASSLEYPWRENLLLTYESVNNRFSPTKTVLSLPLRQTRTRQTMKDSRRVAAFALMALGLTACSDVAKPQRREALLVRAQTLKYQDHSLTIALTGEVRARVQTELSFRVSGQVIERNVDVGQHVDADTLLARLDPSEQKADLDSANAGVGAAEAQLRQASSNFDRQKSLLATGFATKAAYDQAEQAMRTAQGTLDSALAQLGTARDALSYTELRPGKPGTITARNVEIGQVAQPAQSAFTLAEDGQRDVVINVYESIFFLKVDGDTFDVTLAADPQVHALARVREVSPTVDSKNGTVRVKMAIDDAPPEMSLGAAVVVTGRTKPEPAVILPWSAFAESDASPAVWVIDPATNAVSLRRVEVDGFEKEKLVVKSGLKSGERVVTEGGKLLRPGQTVQVDGEAAP